MQTQPTSSGVCPEKSDGVFPSLVAWEWIESVPTAIALLDRDLRYVAVNQRWSTVYGWGTETKIQAAGVGRSLLETDPENQERWQQMQQTCLSGQRDLGEELCMVLEADRVEWVRWEANPWYNGDRDIIGVVLSAMVITPYKQQEQEFQQALQQLQQRYEQRTVQLRQTIASLEEEIGDRLDFEHQLRATESTLKANEQRYQQILNAITDMILVKGPESRIVWANQAFCDYYGMTNEALQNIIDAPFSRPDYTQQYVKDDTYVFTTGQTLVVEEPVVRHDGEVHLFHTVKSALRDTKGEIILTVGVSRDITAQKQAERERLEAQLALQTSQQRLALLIQQMPIALVEWDETATIVEWNPAAEKIFGYRRSEVLGKSVGALIPASAQTNVEYVMEKLLRHKQNVRMVNENLTKEGQTIICEWHNTPLVNTENELINVASMAIDVTSRKQAEAQLKEQEQFLRTIYDGVSSNIFVVDVLENGEFLYADYNRASELSTGRTRAEIAGKTPEELFGDVEGRIIRSYFQQCLAMGEPFTQEEQLTFKTGECWLLTTFNPLRNAEGRIYRIVGTVVDITSLKQVESALQAALQESRYQSQLLRTVLDSTPDWIFVKDQDFRYLLANQSYATAIGHSMQDIIGKTDLELGFAEEAVLGNPAQGIQGICVSDRIALTGQSVHNPNEPTTLADGSQRILDSRKVPLYDSEGHVFAMLGFCRDITDRHYAEAEIRRSEAQLKEKAEQLQQTLMELQQTQAQLVQNEKMSGLGQLVAGVAHEINNPVNFIYGNLNHANEYTQDLLNLIQLYQQHYPQPVAAIQEEAEAMDLEFLVEDLPKLLNSMKVGAERIQKIVASLRTFSRMDEAEMKAVNIHEGIDSTLMILQHRLKARESHPEILIHRHYGELPLVECYAGQLNQVFMNILSNAIDALEEHFRGATGAMKPSGQPHITIRTERLDDWVKIAIADNGAGIPQTVQQRLFDPFFTTKPIGKGTGMGLSISYQIVTEKHRGALHCHSALGQGAEFVIQIPLHQESQD